MNPDEIEPVSPGDPAGQDLAASGGRGAIPGTGQDLGGVSNVVTAIAAAIISSSVSTHSVIITVIVAICVLLAALAPEVSGFGAQRTAKDLVLPATLISRAAAVRGEHPLNSFAALGPLADELIAAQSPTDVYGPIRELAAHSGLILLIGVGLNRMTAMSRLHCRGIYRNPTRSFRLARIHSPPLAASPSRTLRTARHHRRRPRASLASPFA